MEHGVLERALAEMAATDPDRADVAESVVDWLTASEGLETIGLAGVLRFVWYELPVKWLIPPDEYRQVLEAAAELFDRVDLPRYAETCRSPVTTEIHDAYAQSRAEGIEAFRQAYRRSGIDPPNLDDFAWGDVMGMEEALARSAAERALEEAMAEGRFTVGARGWKSAAVSVTEASLASLHPLIPGQTHRTAVLTERLAGWLRAVEQRGPRLYALRNRHVNRLLPAIPVPDDAVERIEPITWLLDRVGEGLRLTQAGYLPPSMAREGCERFGWTLVWTERPARSESELHELYELHELLRRLRAVRVRHNRLYVTSRGREMSGDPELAWRTVAAGLSPGDWLRATAEVFALLLLDGQRANDELEAEAAVVLAECGWQSDGEPPDRLTVSVSWSYTKRLLAVLGGVEESGDWRSRTTRLTEFGEATLLEQIRVEAVGPRSSPW